jgi:hypothetical protein
MCVLIQHTHTHSAICVGLLLYKLCMCPHAAIYAIEKEYPAVHSYLVLSYEMRHKVYKRQKLCCGLTAEHKVNLVGLYRIFLLWCVQVLPCPK